MNFINPPNDAFISLVNFILEPAKEIKELLSLIKKTEEEVIGKSLRIIVEPKEEVKGEDKLYTYEAEFVDANELAVNDSNNYFKHFIRVPIENAKEFKIAKECVDFDARIVDNKLKIKETYNFKKKATPVKLIFTPRVTYLYINP